MLPIQYTRHRVTKLLKKPPSSCLNSNNLESKQVVGGFYRTKPAGH